MIVSSQALNAEQEHLHESIEKIIVCIAQWRPVLIRAFHSNENGLFCTHPLSIAPLFWWKERDKQEAFI